MKRKVLRVGRSSLAVSLPKPFVDTNGIESGQEIDVNHHGASLTVKCEKPTSITKDVDLSELTNSEHTRKLLDKTIGALFKQGADKFIISLQEEHADIIRELIRDGKLNLYEEPGVEAGNELIIHSSITHFDKDALDNMTNVMIKQIYRTLDEFSKMLEEDALTDEAARELMNRDNTVNDHSDICRRIINKDVTNHKSTTLYNFVDKIEKIGDEVKRLVGYSSENLETAREYENLLGEVKEFFFTLFTTNTNFSMKKVDDFYKSYNEVLEKLEECDDTHLYYHYRNMVELIRDACSDLMVRNL